jgi:hypothetical protein
MLISTPIFYLLQQIVSKLSNGAVQLRSSQQLSRDQHGDEEVCRCLGVAAAMARHTGGSATACTLYMYISRRGSSSDIPSSFGWWLMAGPDLL